MPYNSTIKIKTCLCGCGKMPTTSYAGYFYACAPTDIYEKQKQKRAASIKKSNSKKREKAKVIRLAVKSTVNIPVKRKPISRFSKNRLEELKIYSVLRKDYLKDHPDCESPLCTRKSKDIHHKRGRGIYLNAVEYFLAVCRPCHTWIETHPNEAKELGLSLSRLTV